MFHRVSWGLVAKVAAGALAASFVAAPAHAQVAPGMGWGAGTGWVPGAGPAGYYTGPAPMGYPAYPPPSTQKATDIEVGALYAFATGYGVGTGVWIDAEAGIDDPGLQFVAPAIFGVAAPVGVFFLNRPTMPRGMPAAIAAGMAVGAGEGVGIATYQIVTAKPGEEWGFRGIARSIFIGSTVGTVAGFASGYYMEPSPRQSLMLGSGVLWGTVIGSMFGYGGSSSHTDWSQANDSTALGGLVGFNIGVVGAAAISAVWVPSYESLAWMWGGFGAGVVISLPVYLFYVGGDHDPRRGLIFQGAAGTLGLIAGALFTADSRDFGSARRRHVATPERDGTPPSIQITGGGIMPVPNGVGLQVQGILF
jgi:hypothetical protein